MTQSASEHFIVDNSDSATDRIKLFVDEAGDPTIFNGDGEVIIGDNGCSRFFMLGKLEVDDPNLLSTQLTALRYKLLTHPYFAGTESFRPERKKTALLFHAKDDLPEVRFQVFDLLYSLGKTIRFHAVVCDKIVLSKEMIAKQAADPHFRYNPDSLYDTLVRLLFNKFHRLADRYELSIAKRGKKDRNLALKTAIGHAEQDFEGKFGFSRGGINAWDITISNPTTTVCLQAVDYFLWALQRFYEERQHPTTGEKIREDRYLNMLWQQIAEIHDMNFGPAHGTHFTTQKPLTLEDRFGTSGKRENTKKKEEKKKSWV